MSPPRRRPRRRSLRPSRHAIYDIAPGVLLVFKPRGHIESEHAHPHRQRLRIASGRLAVRTGRRTVTLTPASRPLTIGAGRAHTTEAVEDTWLLVSRPLTRA